MSACRICLSVEVKMTKLSENSHLSMLENVIGKKVGVTSSIAQICYKCGHLLKKTAEFRAFCLKTDAIWKKYFRFQARGEIMERDLAFIKQEHSKLSFENLVKTPSICVFNDELTQKTFPLQIISYVKGEMSCRNITKEISCSPSNLFIRSDNDSMTKVLSEKYSLDDINPSIKNEMCQMDGFIPKLVRIKLGNSKIKSDSLKKDHVNKSATGTTNTVKRVEDSKCDDSDGNGFDSDCGIISDGNVTGIEDMTVYNDGRTEKRTKRQLIKINSQEGVEVNLSVEEQKEELLKRSKEEKFLKANFKCNYCMIIFRSEDTLKNHMNKHSEARGNVVCDICTIRFDTHRQLLGHVRLHSFRVDCRLCGNRLRDRVTFMDHMDLHKGNKYPCDKCDAVFSVKGLLKIHNLKDHSNQRFTCEFCNMSFKWRAKIRKHRLIHIKNPAYPCKECGKTFQNMYFLRKHSKKHKKRDNYCVECDSVFSDHASLKAHYATVARHKDPDKLKFPCDKCKKRFETAEELGRHVEYFHDRVPHFSCGQCGMQFASQMGLKHHTRRNHQGYRPPLIHNCNTCGKSFAAKGMLINHIRTHTGERPFECEHCQRRFSQQSAMRTHIKLVHLQIRRKNEASRAKDREKDKDKEEIVNPTEGEGQVWNQGWTLPQPNQPNDMPQNHLPLVPQMDTILTDMNTTFMADVYQRNCYK